MSEKNDTALHTLGPGETIVPASWLTPSRGLVGLSPTPEFIEFSTSKRYICEDEYLPLIGFGIFYDFYNTIQRLREADGFYENLKRPRYKTTVIATYKMLNVCFLFGKTKFEINLRLRKRKND